MVVVIGGGTGLSRLIILTAIVDSRCATSTFSLILVVNSVAGFLGRSVSKPIDFDNIVTVILSRSSRLTHLAQNRCISHEYNTTRIIVGAMFRVAGL